MKKTSLEKLKYKRRFEYLRSIVFDEKTLRQKGAVFEVVKFSPHTSNRQHFHKKAAEIFYIQEGRGFIMINKKRLLVQRDDILFVPPRHPHQVTNNFGKDLVILVFKINGNDKDTFW